VEEEAVDDVALDEVPSLEDESFDDEALFVGVQQDDPSLRA
jgi:hypothetical protein